MDDQQLDEISEKTLEEEIKKRLEEEIKKRLEFPISQVKGLLDEIVRNVQEAINNQPNS